MSCGTYQGALIVVSFDDVLAASADPSTGTYKPFGLSNSKSFNAAATTIDVTNDDTGSVNATLATGETHEITVSGFAALADSIKINQAYLINFFHTRLAAQEQPNLWVKAVFPGYTKYVYCLLTGYSEGGASKEAATIEFTMSATSTCDPTNASIQVEYTPPAP